MLEDPEKPKEVWTDYVWADNEAEAMQKCQIKAQDATVQGKTVVRLIGLPLKVGRGNDKLRKSRICQGEGKR
ncbi:MAG: hypothetical protein RM049_33405 [Nostoc sp. DedQUE04]|uniref:hypothetical protein n=1 Tax=Nostoc sp. DedQUE04 TaxID=3075390 RepID=UPI002AD1DF48|nr:hypothetical protein [Nostoc sp. DedQUE04]MDZ8140135.1 hypothetical protein [Nostoc sp. DedQUE04]